MILFTTMSPVQKTCIKFVLSLYPSQKTMHPNQCLNGKEEPVFRTIDHSTTLSIWQTKAEVRST